MTVFNRIPVLSTTEIQRAGQLPSRKLNQIPSPLTAVTVTTVPGALAATARWREQERERQRLHAFRRLISLFQFCPCSCSSTGGTNLAFDRGMLSLSASAPASAFCSNMPKMQSLLTNSPLDIPTLLQVPHRARINPTLLTPLHCRSCSNSTQ